MNSDSDDNRNTIWGGEQPQWDGEPPKPPPKSSKVDNGSSENTQSTLIDIESGNNRNTVWGGEQPQWTKKPSKPSIKSATREPGPKVSKAKVRKLEPSKKEAHREVMRGTPTEKERSTRARLPKLESLPKGGGRPKYLKRTLPVVDEEPPGPTPQKLSLIATTSAPIDTSAAPPPPIKPLLLPLMQVPTFKRSPWVDYDELCTTNMAGCVQLASEPNREKEAAVAIKRVKASVRDLQKVRSITHDNVVALNAVYFDQGEIFLVYRHCKVCLGDIAESPRRQLDLEEIATICSGILNGLKFVHGTLKRSHGSVNFETVLLDTSDNVKLANVGELLLREPRSDYQQDLIAVGKLLRDLSEQASAFVDPDSLKINHPELVDPLVVDFLSKCKSESLASLHSHRLLALATSPKKLRPFVYLAEMMYNKQVIIPSRIDDSLPT